LKNQITDFIKIHPVGTKLFHADGHIYIQTDMTKLIVIFHSFSKKPKNGTSLYT